MVGLLFIKLLRQYHMYQWKSFALIISFRTAGNLKTKMLIKTSGFRVLLVRIYL